MPGHPRDPARLTRRGLMAGTAVLGASVGSLVWARGGASADTPADVIGARLQQLRRVIARSELPSGMRRRFVVKVARCQQALVDGERAAAVRQLVVLKQLIRLYKDADPGDALTQKFCDRLIGLVNEAKSAIMATIPAAPTARPTPSGPPVPTVPPTSSPSPTPSDIPGPGETPGPTGPTGPTGPSGPMRPRP